MTTKDSLHLNDPEIGSALLSLMSGCEDFSEFGRRVMELAANSLMSAEADEACGAAWGTRDEGRVNSRNGYRARSLKSSFGDLELEVPKLRRGTYYPDSILTRWDRVEASLAALVLEAYANGVSTRDMAALASTLGVASMSSSEVSRLTAAVDGEVEALRSRDLGEVRHCYLWIDATYVRCRVGRRSVSRAVVTAIALAEDGYKHLVGFDVVDTESYADWKAFLSSLKARGLRGLVLCVSDDHAGLVKALSETFQGVAWQRCTVHLQRNVSAAVSRRCDERVVRELVKATFACGDALVARALYPRAAAAVRDLGELKAADLLDAAAGDAQQYLEMPAEHWVKIRTNNVQERANREIKRRYRSVQSFPSEASLVRLVGAVLLGEEDHWQHHRVFSEASTARAWEPPAAEAPDPSLARRIEAADEAAARIVKSVLDRYGSEA